MSIYVKNLDSTELESRFSNENKLSYFEGTSQYSFEDLEPYLEMLPEKEYDLIYMYYVLKKEQKEIAKILRLSQGGVSHRISRAKARLKFLVQIPKFSKDDLFYDLDSIFEELDLNILWGLYETTCQSEVAKRVKMTQSQVRHRFMKNIDTLDKVKHTDSYKKYYEAFKLISNNNYNILREINLPKWANKNKNYLDTDKNR